MIARDFMKVNVVRRSSIYGCVSLATGAMFIFNQLLLSLSLVCLYVFIPRWIWTATVTHTHARRDKSEMKRRTRPPYLNHGTGASYCPLRYRNVIRGRRATLSRFTRPWSVFGLNRPKGVIVVRPLINYRIPPNERTIVTYFRSSFFLFDTNVLWIFTDGYIPVSDIHNEFGNFE